jgi:hypothetical protein
VVSSTEGLVKVSGLIFLLDAIATNVLALTHAADLLHGYVAVF